MPVSLASKLQESSACFLWIENCSKITKIIETMLQQAKTLFEAMVLSNCISGGMKAWCPRPAELERVAAVGPRWNIALLCHLDSFSGDRPCPMNFQLSVHIYSYKYHILIYSYGSYKWYIESCPLSNDTAICAIQISPRISQHPGAPHYHRLWPTSARHFSEDAAGHQVSPSRGYRCRPRIGWFKPIIGQIREVDCGNPIGSSD